MIAPVINFAGGEISPQMYAAVDDEAYYRAAKHIKNFFVTRYGTVEKRPGFKMIKKFNLNTKVQLFPFVESRGKSWLLVMTDEGIIPIADNDLIETTVAVASTVAEHIGGYVYIQKNSGSLGEFIPIGIKLIAAAKDAMKGFFLWRENNAWRIVDQLNYDSLPNVVLHNEAEGFYQGEHTVVSDNSYDRRYCFFYLPEEDFYWGEGAIVFSRMGTNQPIVPTNEDTTGFTGFGEMRIKSIVPSPAPIAFSFSFKVDFSIPPGWKQGKYVSLLKEQGKGTNKWAEVDRAAWNTYSTITLRDADIFAEKQSAYYNMPPSSRSFTLSASASNYFASMPIAQYDLQYIILDQITAEDKNEGSYIPFKNTVEYAFTSVFHALETGVENKTLSVELSYPLSDKYSVILLQDTVEEGPGSEDIQFLVYKKINGEWHRKGFMGRSKVYGWDAVSSLPEKCLWLQDDGETVITAEAISPPEFDVDLTSGGVTSMCISDNRLVLGGTGKFPTSVMGSSTEHFFNFSTRKLGSQAVDGYRYDASSVRSDPIQWVFSNNKYLFVGTMGDEMNFIGATPVAPPERETFSFVGSKNVQPVGMDNFIAYISRNGEARYIYYDYRSDGYITSSLMPNSDHLIDERSIERMAYSRTPYPILWCVTDAGDMLTLSFTQDKGIAAWSVTDTDGKVRDVVVVPRGEIDDVYILIERSGYLYVEKLATEFVYDNKNLDKAVFLDNAATVELDVDAPAISSLHFPDNAEVALTYNGQPILNDDKTLKIFTVISGEIAGNFAAGRYVIGLPYLSGVETMDLEIKSQPGLLQTSQTRERKVTEMAVKFRRSCFGQIGVSGGRLQNIPALKKDKEVTQTGPAPYDGVYIFTPEGGWKDDVSIVIKQDLPLPMTVLGIFPRFANDQGW
jgi:hypothetical protein